MRLGIFGGTFDPVHYGHLLLAESCRETLSLDEVWFLPAARSPHKPRAVMADDRDRLAMVELAIAGHPAFRASPLELDRGGASYTVDTLQQLREEDARRELFLLVGADSLIDFPTWRSPERILELATVVAVNRGRSTVETGPLVRALGNAALARIRLIDMPGIDISATDIRERVAAGRSIRYLTPRSVEAYIHQHALYRPQPQAIT
jgi:nicotinate-nucleotide adenylyltransferase